MQIKERTESCCVRKVNEIVVAMPFHLLLYNARPRSVSQTAAAAAIGVCRSTLSLWERGSRKPPSGDLAKLLHYYAMDAAQRLAVYDAAGE